MKRRERKDDLQSYNSGFAMAFYVGAPTLNTIQFF